MFRTRWIRKLLAIPKSQGQRRLRAAQTRRPIRLMLESLEDRITPSGGNVAVTQSAGSYATLQALITGDTAANTDYTINITNSFTFTAGGQVTISKLAPTSTLKIQTPSGSAPFTLTGNGNRLFDVVGTSQTVTLSNLTLTGGSTVASGGAILDTGGSVTLSGMTVKTNAATGTATAMARGGGLFVSGGGSLSLTDTLIANNTATGGSAGGKSAAGGGVFAIGPSTVTITDSALSGNKATGAVGTAGAAAGASGSGGGSASGGGLFVSAGSGGRSWTVTLKGDILSGNSATGGAGGAGAAGKAGTPLSAAGGAGGAGGAGANASGGGMFAAGNGTLTILDNLCAPIPHSSIMIDNTATGGAGGVGGVGGTGIPAAGGAGGAGGAAGTAEGGALTLSNAIGETLTAAIGNTTFYHNAATGGKGGTGGVGGVGAPTGLTGTSQVGGDAKGGGVSLALLGGGGVTMVNSTVATNTTTGGAGGAVSVSAGNAPGGGIHEADATADTLDNNTITLNTATGSKAPGGGIVIAKSNPTLINNLIQGNLANAAASDLASTGTTPTPLTNATNNFITAISPTTAVNATTNHVGDTTAQLGSVVGVNSFDQPIGGPIYYPLLTVPPPGVYSVGAGTTSVLNTILTVEGTNLATDEAGDLRTSNGTSSGSISLGAVQPLVTLAPVATTIVAGNGSINYYGATSSAAFTITVPVNISTLAPGTTTTGGSASGGCVAIYLASDNNNPPTLLGMATVAANGIATINVLPGALPANLQVGKYDLVENFSGNADFDASNAIGTLSITTAPTTVVAGNASINYYDATPSAAFTIPVAVASGSGTVTGNVAVSLVYDSTTLALTPAAGVALSGGKVSVTVPAGTLPANLPTGAYTLVETYLGNGQFASNTANGTLTITAAPTTVVAGNAGIALGSSTPFAMSAEVNSHSGTVNSGTVTIDLVSDNTTTVLGTGTVSGGEAVVHVTSPAALAVVAALPAGTYDLEETYADVPGGQFAGSGNTGTLTVAAPVTTTLPPSSLLPATGGITTSGGPTTIPVVVNCPGHVANGGTVTISLVNGSTTTVIGSAVASNGVANVPVTIPAGLAPGAYTLVESYSGDANCAPSTTSGTLTVSPATPPLTPGEAALLLAVEAAAIPLIQQGNLGALRELELFSDVFLHQPLPMSIPQLLSGIESLAPQTGSELLPALGAAMFLAQDLVAENPMS